jgi:protein involved in polysaccharide export with SLBB domain
VNLKTGKSQRLQDGDVVQVEEATAELLNIVELRGSVFYPNSYQFRTAMRVKDLIELGGGLQKNADLEKAYIVRMPKYNEVAYIPISLKNIQNYSDPNNIVLQPLDQLIIFNGDIGNINKTIEIRGEVYTKGTFKIAPKMTLKDVLYLANGLKPHADYEHIELGYYKNRGKEEDPNSVSNLNETENTEDTYMDTKTIRVAIKEDWKNDASLDTFFVEKYRYVRVYSRFEDYKNLKFTIRGSVKKATTIPLNPTLTLKDVLYLVGGFSVDADYNHLELGYYLNGGESGVDPNYKLNQEKGNLPTKEISDVRRFAISPNWKDDPTLDTIMLAKYRYLKVYSRYDDYEGKSFTVKGAVKRGISIPLTAKLTLKDVLYLVGGFAVDADYNHLELGYYLNGGESGVDPNYKLDQEKGSLPLTEISDVRRFAINPNWKDDPTLDTIFLTKYRYLKVYSRYEDYEGKTFAIRGAVKRPTTIPLTPKLTLKDVLYLCGGPAENADYNQVELGFYTYSGNDKDPNLNIVFDLGAIRPYTEIGIRRFKIGPNWKDDSTLDTILVAKYRYFQIYPLETYEGKTITVSGSVKNPRSIQLNATLTLRDALFLCGGLEKDADLDYIELSFFQNIEATNADSLNLDAATNNDVLRHISINPDWRTDASLDTILLKNYRYMKVYSRDRFRWKREVSVRGVVESGKTLLQVKGMTLKDVIYLCGGLKRGEEDYYIVDMYEHFRQQDVGSLNLKPHERKIVRFVIDRNWWQDERIDSILVTNYDEIIIHSQNEFYYEGFAEVKGLIKSPGKFKVQPKMSLKDVLYRAGGVPMETDFANVEISRVLKIENTNGDIIVKPVKIKKYAISQDWRNDKKIDSIFIYAFDQIFIRPNYDFRLQKNVFVEGEIRTPGEYSKISPTERLSSLIRRANGLTPESFAAGAKLSRVNLETTDTLVIQLDKAIRHPRSKYDLILREGDVITIPVIDPTVRIKGNVLVPNSYVSYDKKHKSFLYYVNLAGGFAKRTQHNECRVLYANGMSKGTKRVLFFINVYPPILPGSSLIIPQKPEKGEGIFAQRQQVGATIKELTADVASVLSLVALLRAITK